MAIRTSIEAFLLRSPWVRALVPLVLMGVVGVAASALVVEIAHQDSIRWEKIPYKVSFYVLVVAIILSALYQIAVYRFDQELVRGFTPKQYEATIRNRVAEDVARRSQKLIRDGNIEQLERETETFRRLYGEGKQ